MLIIKFCGKEKHLKKQRKSKFPFVKGFCYGAQRDLNLSLQTPSNIKVIFWPILKHVLIQLNEKNVTWQKMKSLIEELVFVSNNFITKLSKNQAIANRLFTKNERERIFRCVRRH